MENPFNNIASKYNLPVGNVATGPGVEDKNNPFNTIASRYNLPKVDSSAFDSSLIAPAVPSEKVGRYQKLTDYKAEGKKAEESAIKANKFGTLAVGAVSPSNLGTGIWDVAKAFTQPKELAKSAVLKLFDGATFGALDYTLNTALINEAQKSGISKEQAQQIADSILNPEDPGIKAVGDVVDFGAMLAPFMGLEKVFIGGMKYAAPEFVKNHAKVANLLKNVGVFNVAGQTSQSFVPEEEQNRGKQAAIDTALAGAFGGAGFIYRKIRHTPFKSPFEVGQVTNTNSLVTQDVVISKDALTAGAESRIAELAKKTILKEAERSELTFLEKNINNPDELYRFNAALPKADVPVPDAKTVATIKTGEVNPKTGEATGPEMSVATNDLAALQDYIKGSGNIDYKIAENLGKDAKGRPIQARHEFNTTTGRHTIYTTEATSASNLAHELGHYFDTKLTGSTQKFSSMIPAFEKNQGAIEDTLGSFAVGRLGGEATSEQISREISTAVQNINREIDALSSARRGKLISSPSERFADAVSEIATKTGSAEQSPVLTALLKHVEKTDTAKLFGKEVQKVLKEEGLVAAKYPDNVVTVNGKTHELSGKALDDYKKAEGTYQSRTALYAGKTDSSSQATKKAIGMEFSAQKRQITGNLTETEIRNAVKQERTNYVGKQVEVEINGKKVPATIETKPSYGNTKVKLEDGTVLSVKNTAITPDTRKVEDIIAKITEREGVKLYEPGAKKATLAQDIVDTSKKQGGMTIDTKGGIPSKGYAYAPEKGTEESFAIAEFNDSHVTNFMEKNKVSLAKEGNHLGLWEDEGKMYLDISRVGEASEKTIAEAQGASQLAIYDLEKGVTVHTGQIKDGVYTKLDEAINIHNKHQGEISGASSKGGDGVKGEIPGAQGGTGEKVDPDLDRGATGKKPQTEAIKAELISTDAEVETFINQKFLSKMTGEERISRSNADIMKQAYDSNLTQDSFDKILKERIGNLPADVVKAKKILADGALGLQNKLAGREISELSGQELKDAMSDYSRLVQTFEVFAGVRTEISNTFRSLGLGVAPGENDVLANALETIQKAIGGETNPFEITKKVVALQQKDTVAKYFELWYPALLSGPKTTARNLVGNFSNLVIQTGSRAFTKQGRTEIMPMIRTMINGHKEAFNNAMAVLKGDTNMVNKFYELPVPGSETFKGKFAFLNNVEYVGRFLNAQDMYFRSLADSAEITAQRVGKFTYGLRQDLAVDVNEAVGTAFANKVTYRGMYDKTVVQEVAKLVSGAKKSEVATLRFISNQITPFVKTVSKITDAGIDFLPIANIPRTFGGKLYKDAAQRITKEAGIFSKIMDDGIVNGMSSEEARAMAQSEIGRVQEIIISRLKDQQMGRFYMGMTVLAAGTPLAVAGRITGAGPKSKKERDTLLATGWRPNSFIMPNGIALPYMNLGPLTPIFLALGNLADAYKFNDTGDNTTNALEAFKGFMRSELDQSFISGISNIIDGVTGYKPMGQMLSELAIGTIPVPAAWSQTKDILFPERYDARAFNEVLRNKLGMTGDFFGTGITEPLQPKLNAFGEQVKADLIYGLTPPVLNAKTDDPVLNFMLKEGIGIAKPNRGANIKGRGDEERKMTPQEYTDFVKVTGESIYEALQPRVESGYFDKFDTKKEKQKAIDSIIKDIRAREKARIRY